MTHTLLNARVRILNSATTAGRPHKFAGHEGIMIGREIASPAMLKVQTDAGYVAKVRKAHVLHIESGKLAIDLDPALRLAYASDRAHQRNKERGAALPDRITNASYEQPSHPGSLLAPPQRPGADDHRQWPSRRRLE